MAEFWEMTPFETRLAMNAARWRDERRQRAEMAMAWRMAALSRTKKLPSMDAYLNSSMPAKKLSGNELQKRRQEFDDLKAGLPETLKPPRKKKNQ